MISQEESLKHTAFCRFEKEHCNQMWQTDFKGDFLLGDGTRCYPLTILDDHSRFSIRIEPKSSTIGVKESFIQAFEEYGLPDAILSDNGSQFAGFRQGITQFERYLMDLDILPIHGRIRHPQTQGKIEALSPHHEAGSPAADPSKFAGGRPDCFSIGAGSTTRSVPMRRWGIGLLLLSITPQFQSSF